MKLAAPVIGRDLYMVLRTDNLVGSRSREEIDNITRTLSGLYPNSGFVTIKARVISKAEPTQGVSNREQYNALGEELKRLLELKDRSITLEILPPDTESALGGIDVTISDGYRQVTHKTVYLGDAIEGARRKLEQEREATIITPVETTEPVQSTTRLKIDVSKLRLKK